MHAAHVLEQDYAPSIAMSSAVQQLHHADVRRQIIDVCVALSMSTDTCQELLSVMQQEQGCSVSQHGSEGAAEGTAQQQAG